MKVDLFYTIIATVASVLLSWGEYCITVTESLKWTVCITSFISYTVPGIFAIAVKLKNKRSTNLIRTTSSIFLFILLILNTTFAFFRFSEPLYIIANAIILLALVTIIRFLAKSEI